MAKGKKFQADLVEQLKDPRFASAYIMEAMQTGDSTYLIKAMNNIVKAHGTSKISRATKLTRQALYKMFSPKGNPSLQSMQSVLESVGLTFQVVPRKEKRAA
jgi:probable addiction module antidote protein